MKASIVAVCLIVLAGNAIAEDTPAQAIEKARRAITDLQDDDGKLRSQYREIVVEQKKLATMAATRAATKSRPDKDKMDKDIAAQKPKVQHMIAGFKTKQETLLGRMKDNLAAHVETLSKTPGSGSITELTRLLDFFAFDSKNEVAELAASNSFLDQSLWADTAKALGGKGKEAIPELKKGLSSGSAAAKVGAAMALGQIGPDVWTADSKIHLQIGELLGKTKNSTIERTERDRRCKVLQEAMDKIRPPK